MCTCGLLNSSVEIDKDVAANKQVDAPDRRIGNYVVQAEDDEAADVLAYAVAFRSLLKPSLQQV